MRDFVDQYVTVAEAATQLHVAESTVRRWIREGVLPAYRSGQRRVLLRLVDVETMVAPLAPVARENVQLSDTEDMSGTEWTQKQGSPPPISPLEKRVRALAARIMPERPQLRRLSATEKEAALAALEMVERNARERAANEGPLSWEVLNELRAERTRQLG